MGIGWTQKMIGFHWDLCDVDTRFVDPDATANHAVTVLEKCLIPVVTFEHDGYFLPCINVLDNYDIDVSKVTMSGPPDFWRLSCEERAAQWFTEAGSGDGQTRKATQHIVGRSWYNV
jgi:hypothetical protein